MSTSKTLAMFTRVSSGGWLLLVHHLLTVAGSLPNCSANHLFVRFCSARTTFSLLMSSFMLFCVLNRRSNYSSIIPIEKSSWIDAVFHIIEVIHKFNILFLIIHEQMKKTIKTLYLFHDFNLVLIFICYYLQC